MHRRTPSTRRPAWIVVLPCALTLGACQTTSAPQATGPAEPRPNLDSAHDTPPMASNGHQPPSRPDQGWSSFEVAFGGSAGGYESVLTTALPLEAEPGLASRHAPNAVQLTYTFDGSDFDPSVSSDGRTVVYASTQHRPTPDIYVKRVGSSVVTQLTNDPASDAMPVLSPDGSRVAFCSDRSGNWDIYVMPSSGGNAVQITSEFAAEVHPSWSSDGSRLVFGRLGQTSGRWEMWVVDVRSPGVAEFIGYGMFPEWCPASGTGERSADRILFQRSRERGDRAFGLWTIDYDNGHVGNLTQLIASPLAAYINPCWSPDGRHIVFASVPTPSAWATSNASRPPSAELWMMPVDGGSRVALTAGDSIDLMPTWGPDNRIYFVSDRSGADNIWSLDLTPAILAATGHEPSTRSVITGQGVRVIPLTQEESVADAQDAEDAEHD